MSGGLGYFVGCAEPLCLGGGTSPSRHPPKRKKRKKTDNPREDGTPPPHRDFKERGVMR